MENKETKENVEYYTLKPRLKQFFGRKITKSLTFDEKTDDKKIHQTLKDLVLTTKIRDTRTITMLINGEKKEIKTKETSTIKQNLVEGMILIWDENCGYIIPQYEMTTLSEIEEDVKAMKEVYEGGRQDDVRGDKDTSTITD